jgi:hypothetical protein
MAKKGRYKKITVANVKASVSKQRVARAAAKKRSADTQRKKSRIS